MPALHVVALISGGKDSLFSILHCLRNGHQVVALANLHPEQENLQDLDSFMYQTVGHNVVELIGQALDLPLYRQSIQGAAEQTGKSYSVTMAVQHTTEAVEHTSVDEVESMYVLLQKVKQAHPEINAVCTGAILSDYQRTRVESVAVRLGMTALSYLWQFPHLPPYSESALLQDMAAVGQDSRIIKVASGGLDESFLWKNVAHAATITRLENAVSRFSVVGDGAVLGEGGEYETLTLNGPSVLWKRSINVASQDLETSIGEAGTSTITVNKATLASKDVHDVFQIESLRVPTMFDVAFQRVASSHNPFKHVPSNSANIDEQYPLTSRIHETMTHVHYQNLHSKEGDTALQMVGIMNQLSGAVNPSAIVFTTILLRDMADFPVVNNLYGSFFTAPNPPSRVTVACGNALPAGVRISLSAIVLKLHLLQQRQGLHVQSQSYWAPANIGPYSQAIASVGSDPDRETLKCAIVYVAGQIPLVPASMELYKPPTSSQFELVHQQCLLSLQHLWRIGATMNVNLWLGAVLFAGRDSTQDMVSCIAAGLQAWESAHSTAKIVGTGDADDEPQDDGDFDVWHQRYGQVLPSSTARAAASTHRDTIKRDCVPPLFVAEVQTLPRNAPVEWSSVGWRQDDGATFRVERTCSVDQAVRYRILSAVASATSVEVASWYAFTSAEQLDSFLDMHEEEESTTLSTWPGLWTCYLAAAVLSHYAGRIKCQLIPCYRLWNDMGTEVVAVMLQLTCIK